MPTLNLEHQLHLSVVTVNLNTTILKLRTLASGENTDPGDRAKYRTAAFKLEQIRSDLGLK